MATRVTAAINHVTREVLFEQSGVSSVELDGGLWTIVFKMSQYFGQKGSLPLTNTNYAVTINYSQNNPLLNDDGYTDYIDTIEVIEDASWEDGKYAQFEWTLPAEASLKNGWLYFNVRIRDRQTNGIWSTKTKKIRVNPVVTGGSSSSLTPTQSDKIDELLDAYPVAYGKEQSLSAKEKYRARTNIGAFGSNSDPVPIRLNAEKTWLDIDEHNGWVTFLRGPYPQMLSSTYGHFDKPLAEIATRIFNGSPVVLEVRSNAGQSVLPDICKTSESIGDISNVLFYPTSVNGNFGPTSELLYQEDDTALSVRFECHDPIVYKNVAVAKYKEYTYTPRESSTPITENFLVVEFSHEDLESVVVTVSGTNNSVASMTAFEIFDAVQNGKNVVLRWPMPNFDNGYYSCKLENSYKSGTAQANAWFTTIIGNDLHWYTIDGDGNARASTVVPIGGGGSGSSVTKVVIGDDGTLPTEYPTVRSILDEIRAGRSVVGYWWMSNQHLEDESYVLVYPTAPILGQQENLELTGTYWNGEQRRMVIMSGQGADDTFTISFVDIPSNNKERDSQIVTPSGNVPTTETTIYTHTVTNAGHYLITANACGQYTSTTVDRVLTLTIKVNGTVKAQTISTSASSWYAECALSINEELSKNDVVTVTVVSSKDSLAVKGVWHAGVCQLC